VEESELVAGLRRADARAFDEAYARFGPRLHRFLLRLAGRRDVADDLYQETWLRLARHATRLAPDTDLGGWLYTVARNRYRSYRRWAILDGLRRQAFAGEPASAPPGPGENAEAASAQARLERAIADLSPNLREAVLLVAIEGLEQERAAAVLGIEPEALRQRLSRARARLREALEPDAPAVAVPGGAR
jgi:RNA polymerase sigma-70 factor (ECF subfamily)